MTFTQHIGILIFTLTVINSSHCPSTGNNSSDFKFVTSDPQHIHVQRVTEDRPGTGTLYYLADTDFISKEWEIYFDSSLTKLASKNSVHKKSATITNYWESGIVKGIEIYESEKLSHVEYYCENGTLVRRKNLTALDFTGSCYHKSDTVYYCNGKFMSTYCATTQEYIYWYENGQKALEGTERNCLNEGTWIEYDTSGQPLLRRYYNHGDLTGIDSIH